MSPITMTHVLFAAVIAIPSAFAVAVVAVLAHRYYMAELPVRQAREAADAAHTEAEAVRKAEAERQQRELAHAAQLQKRELDAEAARCTFNDGYERARQDLYAKKALYCPACGKTMHLRDAERGGGNKLPNKERHDDQANGKGAGQAPRHEGQAKA